MYTERDRYNDEIAALEADIAKGNTPYGGIQGALSFIYQNYGIPAGVSFQEAQGTINHSFGADATFLEPGVIGETGTPAPNQNTGTLAPSAQQLAASLETHNRNVKSINDAYNAGLFDFDMKEKALKQNLEDIKTNMSSQQGSNEAYFSNVSPDVFQSQQGNYNKKILDEYKRNEGNLSDQGTAINMAKGQFNTAQGNAMYSENLFNSTTGAYDAGGQGYRGTLQANVPTLTPVQNSQVGAQLGVPTWAPNYGGMSVQQKQAQDKQDIEKYLSGK